MTTISTIENDPAPGQPRSAGAAPAPLPNPIAIARSVRGSSSFREAARAREPEWFNSPVPSFGDPDGRLLIVGLAPGMQGANRTGRPFTGDYAGDLLYATLLEYGFAKGVYQARPDDGLTLVDCRIGNAVHCVPPQNKPLPVEINTCRPFLSATIETMPRLRAIVALGRIAHEIDAEGAGPSRRRRAVCARRDASGRRAQALRQLSLLALQHQHAGADAGDVSQRVREGQSGFGVIPCGLHHFGTVILKEPALARRLEGWTAGAELSSFEARKSSG